jgi:hypothetical protein
MPMSPFHMHKLIIFDAKRRFKKTYESLYESYESHTFFHEFAV